MKGSNFKFQIFLFALILGVFVPQVYANVTKTVGVSGADYTTLRTAFAAINAGTINTGAITLQIIDNIIETDTAVLYQSGYRGVSNYTSVNIYPTISGKTISGNINKPLIDLSGADSVTIDGRLNATGSTKDLTITNTNISSNAATIRFDGSTENNTVKYCTIKGSETSASRGIISFDGASAGNGNDGNVIDHNDITSCSDAARPINAIFSQGSNGHENSGITISNNNIYDVLSKGTASYIINFEVYTTACTISGNSLYETTSFAPTADIEYNAIRINNTNNGLNITVTGNYIGGSAALCGGSAWTKTNEKNNKFYAIFLNVSNGTSGTTNYVQNNTIKNIAWSNSGAAEWAGIYVSSGSANIGNSAANTIGAASGTITITGGATATNVYGIYFSSTGTINCQNNSIGSIIAANADATLASNFYGIYRASSALTTINNNTIGGTGNGIQTSSTSTSNAQYLIGINNTGGGTLTINNNTIANLTNSTTNTNTGTGGFINGIATINGTLTNNTIRDLTIVNANNASDQTASVCGIAITNTGYGKIVTGNTIYNLSNTYASFAGSVIGLYSTNNTGGNAVSGNFINSLSVHAGSSSATLYGIKINSGTVTYSNNIINLGGSTATTIYGIYDPGTATNTCNLYFNTVYIGGSLDTGVTNLSYCLFSATASNSRNFRNNIFQNARSTTDGVSLHYAAYFNYAVNTSLTLDYNDYYASGTGGVLGFYNSADVSSLPLINTFDGNSLNANPSFASAGGTSAANYIPSTLTLAGTMISGMSNDYALTNRAGTPTIGAYEVTLNLNLDVYKANVFQSSYTTLKGAFDKINNGTHTGALEIRIKGNTTETAAAVLYNSGYTFSGATSNYSSVNIYPTVTGKTISGNMDAYMIDLYGADNVTIDGRLNASGTTKDLTITNTSTGAVNASSIRFYGSAENNIVKYCTIKGSGTNTGRGVIFFSSSSSGNGNDGNIIDQNDITSDAAGRPINLIYSAGASGYENNFNTISNNNIYNFFRTNSNSTGITINSWSTDWTISGNSLYETTSFVPAGAYVYYAINLPALGKHLVSENYIGGSAALCGGSAMTINASFPHYFRCIYISGGSTTETASTVQNNIIQNINYTSTQSNPWDGIYIKAGNVNITGNTIGATTGTGSIVINTPAAAASTVLTGGAITSITMNSGGSGYITPPIITFSTSGSSTAATATASLTDGVVTVNLLTGGVGYTSAPTVYFDGVGTNYSTSHGINNYSAGTVNITNNNLGSITTVGSSSYSHGIESIYISGGSGTYTISNNLIGSLTTANSIYTSSTAATAVQKQDIYGINCAGIGTNIITGNTVANLTNGYTGTNTGTRTRGISTSGGSNTIQDNTVRNISSASAQNVSGSSTSVIGVSQLSTTAGKNQTIIGNKIYNLSNSNATAKVDVSGIYYAGPTTGTHEVSGNFIHSLSISSSTNTGSCINGIAMNSGAVVTCANNIINLGGNTLGYQINGILDGTVAGNTFNLYFNTVYIGGTVSSGVTSATATINNANSTSIRDYRNNILYNARTGGITGKHYAIILAGTANTTIDYNDYFLAGTVLGKIGTLEKANLAAWKLGTSQDVNSISIDPLFTSAGGTSILNYYTTAVLPGFSGTGVTSDYAGLSRGVTPKIGALEANGYTWQGGTSTDFGTAANWTCGAVPPDGADIYFAETPARNCILDINRIVGDITNSQSTYKLVLNGKQLTINDSIIFTNSAKIDATTASSKVVFAGTIAQIIPTGSFVSNTVDSLTINNTKGLTLNGDFTINKGIALMAGNFAIGANTLTIDGIVTAMTGTISGGISTNMIIGGSGSVINMPAVSLNNLTINRTNGVSLYGNLSIAGTLTLTNGTLNVGSNTLTLSSLPIRTSGSIDASNAAATLVFANSAAITLPASIFSAAINNFTLSGAGGITSNSDITVNGVLSLSNSNPSTSKGLLDMWDGSVNKTLTMGANATTVGTGDVTGIVKRNSFVASNDYTFGNQFTTMTFSATGTMPTDMSFKIGIGSNPSWKTTAVQRTYDIIRTGGTGTTVTLKLHYLDAELQANTENNLVIWDYHTLQNNKVEEHGKANQNITDNWVAISNRSITYFATAFATQPWFLSNKEFANFTWQGTPSTDWNDPNNWSGGNIPTSTSDVIIPDASTTIHDPVLTDSLTFGVNTINIQSGGVLYGGTATTLTVAGSTGAWFNEGTFNAGTSTVIFTNANATMADPTNFYNVTIATGAALTPGTDNIMRIAGALTLEGTGIMRAALLPNTIEFNGTDQTIVNPNGLKPGYYNLILSGSGTKTLPATALSVAGDFTISGTATATAESAMTIDGIVSIDEGSTFITGNYNHTFGGDFYNSGTFTATAENTVTMNGASAQSINGISITNFYNLTINNSHGVTILADENINNILTLTSGNFNIGTFSLGINGTISKTSGFIEVSSLSSLSFGGTSALTLPSNLFSSTPSINNLTVNRSGGVTLGNQNMTINGLLHLSSGIFNIGANTFTISTDSPTRTSGSIDASNSASTLTFSNVSAITLPASFFSASVNNLTLNGTGGVTTCCDFTVNGILYLQSANPSDNKGILDLWDGTVMKTLTMGASATTVGIGDVTGIITRTTINPLVTYSFGNQFTTAYFPAIGTLPTQISAKIRIGTAPTWRSGAINREIEIIQTGASHDSPTKAVFSCHFLDSELNGNDEEHLVFWVKYNNLEYGRSAFNSVDDWISLSNIDMAYYPSVWDAGTYNCTLDEYSTTETLTWNGSTSDSWTTAGNWTPGVGPSSAKNIIIPDASTTINSPTLPSTTEIKTLTIDAGGVLNSVSEAQLTINGGGGAWINDGGTFNPNTSNVIFTGDAATFTGSTNFYNLALNSSKNLTMESGSTLKIAGTVTNNGTWHTVNSGGSTTVEYNGGSQIVVVPNSSTDRYYNLILSGSGTKTLPATALSILGDLTISGTATATADGALTLSGNLNIGSGSTFAAGSASHSIAGNIVNDGTITPSTGTITLNGSSAQSIEGSAASSFYNLIIANALGVMANKDITSNSMTINSGKLFTIAPAVSVTVATSITNSAGISGLLLKSSETLANGSLIYHNEYASPVSATVEMYSKASKPSTASKWQFFGIPLRSMTAEPTFYGSYVRQMYETATTSSAHWIQLQNTSSLTSFTGYEITQVSPKTIYFQGDLENKDFDSGKLSYTSGATYIGQHLIGNPYTAAIDITKIQFGSALSTIIDNTVYLYNCGSLADWTSAGSGAVSSVESATAGQYVSVPIANAGVGGLPSQIPSMQAFLVMAKSDNSLAWVKIPYSSTGTVVKNTSLQRARAVDKVSTRIDVKGASYGDQMWMISEPTSTRGFDNGWDGYKMFGPAASPRLFSMETSGNYQVNSIPDFNNTDIGFQAGTDTNYTLTFTHENIESAYSALYLIDLVANQTKDITISGTQYSFTAAPTAQPVKRFRIVTNLGGTTGNYNDKITTAKLSVFYSDKRIFVQNFSDNKGDLLLYDMTGRFIQKLPFSSNGVTAIPVNLTQGLYIAKSWAGTEVLTESIIIK